MITRVDKRNNLSGQIIKMVRDAYESLNIFDSQIPERIAVGKSLSKHELVAGFEKIQMQLLHIRNWLRRY